MHSLRCLLTLFFASLPAIACKGSAPELHQESPEALPEPKPEALQSPPSEPTDDADSGLIWDLRLRVLDEESRPNGELAPASADTEPRLSWSDRNDSLGKD